MFETMRRDSLLLSVRPDFANRILDGFKTVELRRVRPSVRIGQDVLIYGSSPVMALVGRASVKAICVDTPHRLWKVVRNDAGVSESEYLRYFEGARIAAGIVLENVRRFDCPLTLRDLRESWPDFSPPQSYRFVIADFARGEARPTKIAPR